MSSRRLAPVLLVLAAACAAAPGEPTETSTSPIVNGKDSTDAQDAAVLIVHRISSSEAIECTGTLLAPNLVLTARHCVSKTTEQGFACDASGNGTAGGAVQEDFVPASLVIYGGTKRRNTFSGKGDAAGVKILHDAAKNLCNHDLALILLDKPVTGRPIAKIRLDSPAVAGELFTAVGWGVTATTDAPSIRQQRTGVKIEHVGPMADSGGGLAVGPNEFRVGESICQGDSGGPALDQTSGAVVGVVSRGGNGQSPTTSDPAASCREGANFYIMTSAFKDLILAAYAEAGQDPWLEAGPDPRLAKLGEACTGPEACRSSLCLTDPKGAPTTCTESCETEACPAGYKCTTQGAAKVCTVPVAAKKVAAAPGTTTTTTTCAIGKLGSAGGDAPVFAWGLVALAALGARRRKAVVAEK